MLPIRNISILSPISCNFLETWINSYKIGQGCSTPLIQNIVQEIMFTFVLFVLKHTPYQLSNFVHLYSQEVRQKLGHKLSIADLLIKPVQRIMKYQLLLKVTNPLITCLTFNLYIISLGMTVTMYKFGFKGWMCPTSYEMYQLLFKVLIVFCLTVSLWTWT